MALPKLNDTPKYDMVIPSLGEKVTFRPFLVKEEKVLLLALESESQQQIMNTIVDTIKACIYGDLDVRKLTTFDVELMFLKIRSKSVGETSDIGLTCEHCEAENEITINIDDIHIDMPNISNKIKLNDDITLEMKWPNFSNIMNGDILNTESGVNQIFGLILSCISSIMTNEERYSANDHTKEELESFIESMNGDQFAKVREYVEAMPRLTHEVQFTCNSCTQENKINLEGMQNFL